MQVRLPVFSSRPNAFLRALSGLLVLLLTPQSVWAIIESDFHSYFYTAAATLGVGDMENDGYSDLVYGNAEAKKVRILRGVGTIFLIKDVDTSPDEPRDVTVGDFNGDSRQDFAFVDLSSNRLIPYYQTEDRQYVRGDAVGIGQSIGKIRGIVSGDFNNDGRADIVVTNAHDNTLSLLVSSASNGFDVTTINVTPMPMRLHSTDLNEDGNLDLIVGYQHEGSGSGSVEVFFGNGTSFEPPLAIPIDYPVTSVGSGDFNEDGILDIAVYTSHAVLYILDGNGDSTFAVPRAIELVALGSGAFDDEFMSTMATADFNGDGHVDIALPLEEHGVRILLGDGGGQFPNTHEISDRPYPRQMVVGDFNNDRSPDLTLHYEVYGTTYKSYDYVPPPPPVIQSPPQGAAVGRSVEISGTAERLAYVGIFLNGAEIAVVRADGSG